MIVTVDGEIVKHETGKTEIFTIITKGKRCTGDNERIRIAELVIE